MGLSIEVYGFVRPDDKWKKMKAVWDACLAAGIEAPDDVDDYFDGVGPDAEGQRIPIKHRVYEDGSGVGVAMADVPKRVSILRIDLNY